MPGRKSREYARYSPPLLFSSFVLYTRLLRSNDGAQEQKIPGAYFDMKIPDGQELSGGSQAGGLAFSICVMFVLAFLRQTCTLCLYSDTITSANLCSRAFVFEPSWPLACNMKLVLFLFIELCCDIPSWHPDLGHVQCVYV